MSETFGPDFITVTDEDGNEFELELVDTLEHNGITYHALFPAVAEDEETGEPVDVDADDEEYGLVIMKTVEENGEELLSTLDSDEEIEESTTSSWSASLRTKTSDPLRSQVSFPARCVMGLFKPTFFKRDAPSQRGLQASRPPLRLVGCWKQKSVVEATHLPSRAGFKQVHTARAGLYKIHLDLGRGISRGLFLFPRPMNKM